MTEIKEHMEVIGADEFMSAPSTKSKAVASSSRKRTAARALIRAIITSSTKAWLPEWKATRLGSRRTQMSR